MTSLSAFEDRYRAICARDARFDGRFVTAVRSTGIDLALPVREPFDAAGVFAWLAQRATAGVEEAEADSFARSIRLPGGVGWFQVREGRGGLRLRAEVEHLADLGALIARVRSLFDLDSDPVAVDRALSADPTVARLVARVPGIRIPGAVDPFEMLVRAMIGQQISVRAARTHVDRLVHALGERVEIAGRTRTLFPTAEAIAADGAVVLRGPARRVDAIVGVARAYSSGSLALTVADDVVDQRAALLAMPGIGPWTVDYMGMRVGRDTDVLLGGDLALRRGAASVGLPSEALSLTAWSSWAAPWRSYLSMHLWRVGAHDQEVER